MSGEELQKQQSHLTMLKSPMAKHRRPCREPFWQPGLQPGLWMLLLCPPLLPLMLPSMHQATLNMVWKRNFAYHCALGLYNSLPAGAESK